MPYVPVFYHPVPSIQPEYLWIVIVGGLFCFGASWGIGANDTSNSWGSTVGAKAISVRNAAILAGIFEVTGAFSLGATVGGTLKSGITPPEYYCEDNYSLVVRMIGMLSAVLGMFVWLVVASRMGMPVSTTHAAVGGICGFGIVTRGWGAVVWWPTMGKVFISWVTSPLLSALLGCVLQWSVMRLLFSGPPGSVYRKNVRFIPAICGLFIGVAVVFALFIGGKSNAAISALPAWVFGLIFFLVSAVMVLLLYGVAHWVRRRRRIDADAFASPGSAPVFEAVPKPEPPTLPPHPLSQSHNSVDSLEEESPLDAQPFQANPLPDPAAEGNIQAQFGDCQRLVAVEGSNGELNGSPPRHTTAAEAVDIYAGLSAERVAAEELWKPLCWVVAATESFVHGANDVGNAIGPYAAMIDSYEARCPAGSPTIPYWVLGVGACGILVGLATYGHRVMRTLGVEIAVITPQRAVASEMATVLSVLLATAMAIPVSTTHCAVGGIAGVAVAQFGWREVNWRTLSGVAWCLVLTVPACALMTAAVFGLLQ
eukprot:EG_transcript_9187